MPKAKLWFVGGLVSVNLSGRDKASMERLEQRTEEKLKTPASTEVRWIRYGERPHFFERFAWETGSSDSAVSLILAGADLAGGV